MEKIEPDQKQIASATNLIPSQMEMPTEKKKRVLRCDVENSLLPVLHTQPGTGINFTTIPENSYPEGSTAAEITFHSLDTSFVLEQILSCWKS